MSMTQEDKKLLLRDLSARLLDRVKCIVDGLDGCTLMPYDIEEAREIKPYLRSMSSMTDGELIEFLEIRGMNLNSEELKTFREGKTAIVSKLPSYSRHIDWLNAHHFDYRGLIERGLAIAVDENNNPYKE